MDADTAVSLVVVVMGDLALPRAVFFCLLYGTVYVAALGHHGESRRNKPVG